MTLLLIIDLLAWVALIAGGIYLLLIIPEQTTHRQHGLIWLAIAIWAVALAAVTTQFDLQIRAERTHLQSPQIQAK